ncbi:MAG: hypothetical protein WD269_11130 [Acidimicrobiia bacterium]
MNHGKALKRFEYDYVVASLEVGGLALDLRVRVEMMAVLFLVTEPIVSAWKLKAFDSRSDALILRTLAFLVDNSISDGRELSDINVLEACFHRAAGRCPSALEHMSTPDWDLARRPSPTTLPDSKSSDETGSTKSRNVVASEPDAGPQPLTSADERTRPKSSTTTRMNEAAETYGPEELMSTLDRAPQLVQFSDLDRAMQIAIDTIVRTIAKGRSDEVRRYCGSTLITGYIVGRAMLGTENGALHYSNPLTESDSVESLVRMSTTEEAAPFTDALGEMGHGFMKFQIEMAGRAGPLAALVSEERENLAGGSAAAGLVLAVVEHDLFAA